MGLPLRRLLLSSHRPRSFDTLSCVRFIHEAAGTALAGGRAPAWARKTAHAVVGWFALVGTAVVAMGVAMALDEDPNASVGLVAVFSVTAVAAIALALWTYRPLTDLDAH